MTKSPPSLLVNKQTTVHPDADCSYGSLLRSTCAPEFYAALRTYSILDGGPDNDRARRLKECRTNAWFTRNVDSGEVRVASSACSLRWCPVCSNSKRNYMTHSIAEWLVTADHPKLITVTLLHSSDTLDEQIDRLYKCFRELRRRKEIKEAITGGIWFFQITKSESDGRWHPHIHSLVTGLYFPRKRLSRLWLEVTTDSTVTDIRTIYEPRSVANDVARYATSPCNLSKLPPDDAIEVVEALNHRRICGTWGTARGISLRAKLKVDKAKWVSIGSWSIVVGLAETNKMARAILLAWRTGKSIGVNVDLSKWQYRKDMIKQEVWADYDYESVYDHERVPP